jgi:hypothetical protein
MSAPGLKYVVEIGITLAQHELPVCNQSASGLKPLPSGNLIIAHPTEEGNRGITGDRQILRPCLVEMGSIAKDSTRKPNSILLIQGQMNDLPRKPIGTHTTPSAPRREATSTTRLTSPKGPDSIGPAGRPQNQAAWEFARNVACLLPAELGIKNCYLAGHPAT